MHHTKGLVSDKSNQKLSVSLFDVLAVSFSLRVTTQALEAQECKQQKDVKRGKSSVVTSEGHGHLLMHRSFQWHQGNERMKRRQRGCVCVCALLCTEEERLHWSAPSTVPEGRNRTRRAMFLSGGQLGRDTVT